MAKKEQSRQVAGCPPLSPVAKPTKVRSAPGRGRSRLTSALARFSLCPYWFLRRFSRLAFPLDNPRGRLSATGPTTGSHLGPHEIEVTHHGHVFMLDVMAVEHIVTNVIFGPGRSGPRIRLRYKFEHDPHCVATVKVSGFLQALLLRTRRLPIPLQHFEHVSMDVDGMDPAARTIGQGPNLYRTQPWPCFPVLPITGNDVGLEEFSIYGPFSMTPLELKFSGRHRLLWRKDFLNVPCRVIPPRQHGVSVIGCDGRISFGSFRSNMKSQERRAALRREIVRASPFSLL